MSVKPVGVLVLAWALAADMAGAQDAPARVGVMAGANFATVAGGDVHAVSGRVGVLAGASFVKPISSTMSVLLDVLYSMKGFDSGGDNNSSTRINYLELPVLLRIDLSPTSRTRPFLEAGPSVAFKVGCKLAFPGVAVTDSVDCNAGGEHGFEVNSLDIGLAVGGGLDVSVGTNTLTLGARYTMGLTEFIKDVAANNRAVSVYVGWSLPLKR